MNTILEFKDLAINITRADGLLRAVDGLSFSIDAGRTYGLIGESGCGKSISALAIMRLLPAQAQIAERSQIIFADQDISKFSNAEMRRLRGHDIAMIFQDPMASLNPVLTIEQQLVEVLQRKYKSGLQERALELLDLVNIPDPKLKLKVYPHQLSGGQKQRIMIAIALALQPKLLIADEPTTALDVTTQKEILALLQQLQAKFDMAILLITHDLAVASQMADTIGVMYAGHLVEQANPEQFFSGPKHPYAQKLLHTLPGIEKRGFKLAAIDGVVPSLTQPMTGCRFANRCDLVQSVCKSQAPKLYDFDSHQVRCCLYEAPDKQHLVPAPEQLAHNVQQLAKVETTAELSDFKVYYPIKSGLFKRTKAYVKAVDGIDLKLEAQKILALVGESGCGKTTLGYSLLQLLPINSGRVVFFGSEQNFAKKYAKNLRQQLQIIFQDPFSSMDPRMRVGEIIAEGMLSLGVAKSKTDAKDQIDKLLSSVSLKPEMQHRFPHEFSGGQRQRIAIARALAVKPRIIICDEPTSALDVSVQAQILNLLQDLKQSYNLSLLFITHNISVVAYLADQIAVMYQGKIVEQADARAIIEDPQHQYTKELIAAVPQIVVT